MRINVQRELRIFGFYFVVAFIAELAGFIGWMNEMSRGGDMFQISNAFLVHEVSRLWIWLPVFVGISGIRLLTTSVISRSDGGQVSS